MKWYARLRFKACGYRLVRQEVDSAGNAVGEPLKMNVVDRGYKATPDRIWRTGQQ